MMEGAGRMSIRSKEQQHSNHAWFIGLLIITVLAVFFRILSWEYFGWTKGGVPFSDSRTLDMWAINILDGVGFRGRVGYWLYEAFRMPFFSVVLASMYAIFGWEYVPVRIVLCGFSVVTCLGVAGIGRLLFNRTAGFIAGLLCALYYPLVYYSHALMTETLSVFLFVFGVYAFLRSLHERSWGFALGSGIALGLAGMTRFSLFAVLPILFVYLVTYPIPWSRKLRLGTLWLTMILVSFSPWVVRNAMLFDTFFPSGSGGARMLWNGANPKYGGTSLSVQAWRDIFWEDPGASEIERTRRIKGEVPGLISENPEWYLSKTIWRGRLYLKLPSFSTMTKVGGSYRYWNDLGVIFAAWLGYIGFFLALFKRPRSGLFLGGLFASLLALHSLAGEAVRYRLVSEWIWLVGAAYSLYWLSQLFRQSFFAADTTNDPPIVNSFFDKSAVRWGVPIFLLFPFVMLAIQIPANRALKEEQQVAVLQGPVEDFIAANGFLEKYRAQGNVLHDISHYKKLAFSQSPDKVTYPSDVVIFSGELSHFICNAEGEIQEFSLKVNKAGLYVGDAQLICYADKSGKLLLPETIKQLKRAQGVIIGTVYKTGPLGDIVLLVSDIVIGGQSIKRV